MSYRNDPYDPKQAALLDPAALEAAVLDAEKAFDQASDLDALGALKPLHLGDRSPVSLARREIGSLPPHAKSGGSSHTSVLHMWWAPLPDTENPNSSPTNLKNR